MTVHQKLYKPLLVLPSLASVVCAVRYHDDLAIWLSVSVESAAMILILMLMSASLAFLWCTERDMLNFFGTDPRQRHADLDVLENVLRENNRYSRQAFSMMLIAGCGYAALYLEVQQRWLPGAAWLASAFLALLILFHGLGGVLQKLRWPLQLTGGLSLLVAWIWVLWWLEGELQPAGQGASRGFPDYLLALLFFSGLVMFFSLIVGLSSLWSIARIWRLLSYSLRDLQLLRWGTDAERGIVDSLSHVFQQLGFRRCYLAVLVAPLYFALAEYVDARWLTLVVLSGLFLPVILAFSRYCQVLPSARFFAVLKISYVYLFALLLAWEAYLHGAMWLYVWWTDYFHSLSFALNAAFFPDFVFNWNRPLSTATLVAQLEGSVYAFILLLQVSYFLAALRTRQFGRLAAQLFLNLLLVILFVYNHRVTADSFTFVEAALLTPQMILVTLVPLLIEVTFTGLAKLGQASHSCAVCESVNRSEYNHCYLCGNSLRGAELGYVKKVRRFLYQKAEALQGQVEAGEVDLVQAQETIAELASGMAEAANQLGYRLDFSTLAETLNSRLRQRMEETDG